MRRPYFSFKRRRAEWYCNPLIVERLEDRLALSVGPLALPYESVAVSPFESHLDQHVANSAFTAGMSPSGDSVAGSAFGTPSNVGIDSGAVLSPLFTGYYPASTRQIPGAPIRAIDTEFALTIVVVDVEDFGSVVRLSEVHAEIVVHTEASPTSSVASVDSRVARPAEATQAAIAESDHHSALPAPAVSFGSEALVRVSQAANSAAPESRTPAFAIPTLPPPATSIMNRSGDTGLGPSQPPLTLAPQPGLDTIAPPNSRHLPSEPNLGKLGSSASLPDAHAEQPLNDRAAVTPSPDGAAADGVAAAPSGNKAALLASLPFNMDAVDRALVAMMSEVEGLGSELVMWVDDSSLPSWAAAATLTAACGAGGRYVWRKRGRRSPQEESEEESSSWLFTRLQSPVGKI